MGSLRALGKRIQLLRENKHLTQEKLEEKTGVNAKYLSAVERGSRNVTIKTLEKIAQGLGVELYELFLYSKEGEAEDALRQGIEKLLKEADRKKLQLYFDILRAISTS